jgi:hypothetical protein
VEVGGAGAPVLVDATVMQYRSFSTSADGSKFYAGTNGKIFEVSSGGVLTDTGSPIINCNGLAHLGADMWAVGENGTTLKQTGGTGAFVQQKTGDGTFVSMCNWRGQLIAGRQYNATSSIMRWSGSAWEVFYPVLFDLPRGIGVSAKGDLYLCHYGVGILRMWGR